MSHQASASIRRWIKWGSADVEEPTSTLVLTVPSGTYVDVRIFVSEESTAVPAASGKFNTTALTQFSDTTNASDLPLKRLEWGFGGQSSHEALGNGDQRGSWRHWVDSRHDSPQCDELFDTGIMKSIGRNDESGLELTSETGSMLNPSSGQVEDYEECWGDVSAVDQANGVQEVPWVVLRTLDPNEQLLPVQQAETLRGLVIRVGSWCQGIIRKGDSLLVERWYHDSTASAWLLTARLHDDNQLQLPSNAVRDLDGVIKGHILECGGIEWQVEEMRRLANDD